MLNTSETLTGRSLLAAVDLVAIAESYGVTLKKEKGEYVGLCPFHNDTSPSLNINARKRPNLFTCRSCGEGGSPLDFIMQAEHLRGNFIGQKQAFEILENDAAGGTLPRVQATAATAEAPVWEVLAPVPPDAPPAVFSHYQLGLAVSTWAYKDAAGNLLGYTARFLKPDGSKDVLPLSYCQNAAGKRFWRWQGQPVPRPLYGLDRLAAAPAGVPVLIVEGEKTADAANLLFAGSLVALTWAGGSTTVRFADWTPLRGRNVIGWPDADSPGARAMLGYYNTKPGYEQKPEDWKSGVLQFAQAAGATAVKAVRISPELPEGWDLADAPACGWDNASAMAYLRQHIEQAPEGPTPAVLAKAPQPAAEPAKPPRKKAAPKPVKDEDPEESDEENEDEDPYRPLGYRKNSFGQNEFYIYSYKARQALRFTAANFTKSGLLQLANTAYWEANFSTKNQGYETKAAQYLINACYDAGVYDAESVRGIGAWLDGPRVVVHAGTHLVAEGQEYPLQGFDSPFLYEANRPFGFKVSEPLESAESAKFAEVIRLLTWERPAYADLFIGWCIIAPVCGALNWRPHIWLTGPAGSGKTTAMSLLHRLVGNIALRVQGNTTEAAIRQLLNQDARPVCFDEADSDGMNDNNRLQTILSLVRAASSHDGGGIAKGGSNGTAQTFLIRSCFAFASITPKVANAADKSRVSVLSLVKPPEILKTTAEKNWQTIEAQLHECFSPERCERLQARTLSLLPQILENAKVFSRAAALVLGEQRAGDQLGVLLAGAYSLKSRGIIKFEDAKKWIEARNWDEIRNDEKDETMLLSKIMEQPARVKTNLGAEHERTVGELILIAHGGPVGDEVVDRQSAAQRLGRLGIKADADALYISNTADWVTKVLRGTAWATNHGKVLGRLPGAESIKNMYFGGGVKSRAVKIPIAVLMG